MVEKKTALMKIIADDRDISFGRVDEYVHREYWQLGIEV